MSTPIERLRARHTGLHQCDGYWYRPMPHERCNIITVLDGLEAQVKDAELMTLKIAADLWARLDAATELIRQTMEELHGWHEWVAGEGGAPIVCPGCGPFREWLEGSANE